MHGTNVPNEVSAVNKMVRVGGYNSDFWRSICQLKIVMEDMLFLPCYTM